MALWTRRTLLKKWLWTSLLGYTLNPPFRSFISTSYAQAKKILSKGFPKNQLLNMNPAEIDNRDLDIDPLKQFGTMGSTDVVIDMKNYRLDVTGKVDVPLSLKFDDLLKYSLVSEVVLLICPGFFSNNGSWTGVSLLSLIQKAEVRKEAAAVVVKGADGKSVRIPIGDLHKKKILLACRVNGEPLPRKHGFPLRLVYEDAYGSDWVKYVQLVEVT